MSEYGDIIIQEANRLALEDPRRTLGIALGNLVSDASQTKDVMLDVLASREQFTPEHLTPLLFASLQYQALQENADISSFGTKSSNQWEEYIETSISSRKDEITKLLKERNVQSFILRRYLAAKLTARAVYGDAPVSMLDIGCSLNLGLAAVANDISGEQFRGILVNEVPQKLYTGKVDLVRGIGIDLFEPDTSWVKACIWPDHQDERDTIDKSILLLRQAAFKPEFLKLNALKMGDDSRLKHSVDIVVASGMFYQFSEDLKGQLLTEVIKVTNGNGYLLVNDYPPDANAKDPFTYKTEVIPIEEGIVQTPFKLLKAEGPFYKHIKLDEDFQSFIETHGAE